MKAPRFPRPPLVATLIALIGLGLAGFQFFLAYNFYTNLKFSLGMSGLLNMDVDLNVLQEGRQLFLGTLWSGTLLAAITLVLFYGYLSLNTLLRMMRERPAREAPVEDEGGV